MILLEPTLSKIFNTVEWLHVAPLAGCNSAKNFLYNLLILHKQFFFQKEKKILLSILGFHRAGGGMLTFPLEPVGIHHTLSSVVPILLLADFLWILSINYHLVFVSWVFGKFFLPFFPTVSHEIVVCYGINKHISWHIKFIQRTRI